jgi:hypothetical protein
MPPGFVPPCIPTGAPKAPVGPGGVHEMIISLDRTAGARPGLLDVTPAVPAPLYSHGAPLGAQSDLQLPAQRRVAEKEEAECK